MDLPRADAFLNLPCRWCLIIDEAKLPILIWSKVLVASAKSFQRYFEIGIATAGLEPPLK